MKKIEKKIIDKVYRLETKRTVSQIFWPILGFLLLIFFSYIFISLLVGEWFRQQTFDLLLNFTEGIEVASHYFFDSLMIIYQETPKALLLLILLLLFLMGMGIHTIAKNKKIMQNKVKALTKYWLGH